MNTNITRPLILNLWKTEKFYIKPRLIKISPPKTKYLITRAPFISTLQPNQIKKHYNKTLLITNQKIITGKIIKSSMALTVRLKIKLRTIHKLYNIKQSRN